MLGSPYYKILGLPEGASDAQVKKQFRTLAKLYHPDTNPDEQKTEKFIEILDAYERILKKDFVIQSNQSTRRTTTSENEDFHKKARMRYERFHEERAKDLEEFYTMFLVGKKRNLKIGIGILGFCLSVLLILDLNAPFRIYEDRVVSYSNVTYQSMDGSDVNEIVTAKQKHYYIANYKPQQFEKNPKIKLYETRYFRLLSAMGHGSRDEHNPIAIHFTFYWMRYVLLGFFIFSFFLIFGQKPSAFLTFCSYFSVYIIGSIMVLFLIFNFHIVSFFNLGNWP